jgi:hypothetical protein
MSSQVIRDFNKELVMALNANVKVLLEIDYPTHFYTGKLTGVEISTQAICLVNAKDDKNNKYEKIFIHGSKWISFSIEGEPFPMQNLVNRLRKILPGEAINLADDNTITLLGGKIMITEKGVEGRGPTKNRVQTVFDNFVTDWEASQKK